MSGWPGRMGPRKIGCPGAGDGGRGPDAGRGAPGMGGRGCCCCRRASTSGRGGTMGRAAGWPTNRAPCGRGAIGAPGVRFGRGGRRSAVGGTGEPGTAGRQPQGAGRTGASRAWAGMPATWDRRHCAAAALPAGWRGAAARRSGPRRHGGALGAAAMPARCEQAPAAKAAADPRSVRPAAGGGNRPRRNRHVPVGQARRVRL